MKSLTSLARKHKDTLYKIGWRAIQAFSKQGVSLIIFFLLTGILSVGDFGKYNYIFAIITLLNTFSDFGVSLAITKLVTEYTTSKKHSVEQLIFNAALLITILASILILVTLLFGKAIFGDYYSELVLLLPLLLLMPMGAMFEGVYRGVELFKKLSIISVINGIASIIIILLAGKFYGLNGILLAQDLTALISLLTLILAYKKIEIKFNRKLMMNVLKYSALIGVANLSLFFYTRIDVLIMGNHGYFNEISYYEIINKILVFVMMPLGIIGQVIAPSVTRTMVEKRYTDLRSKFRRYLLVAFIFSTVVTILMVITYPIAINFLPKYNSPELKQMFVVMIPVFFFEMLNGINPVGFVYASGHASLSTKFLLFFGFVNTTLDLIFINMFGYIGIIYSSVIARSLADILFIFSYYNIIKKLNYETKTS